VSGRLVVLVAGFAAVVAIGQIAGCYDVPMPPCGFVCGPGGACPDGYTCAADEVCHRDGSPPSLVCTPPDAGSPTDAAVDATDAAIAGPAR
jgi:hypothetical protein